MIRNTTRLVFLCLLSVWSISVAHAQDTTDPFASTLPLGRTDSRTLAELDLARPVVYMDALPDGSKWFVIDKFGPIQSMLLNGKRIERTFNNIPFTTAQFSPNSEYIIWMGLDRIYTEKGFDSTITNIYRNDSLVGSYLADYGSLEFSRTGAHWGAILPFANVLQTSARDFAVADGKVLGYGEDHPRQFSFNHDETKWAYRTTKGKEERLLTSDGPQTLFVRLEEESIYSTKIDSTILRFTPDVSYHGLILEGRDYDFGFEHVGQLRKTSFDPAHTDTARSYFFYNSKAQQPYRWLSNILIDSSGKHTAYFACDPQQEKLGAQRDERRAVMVYDGKVIVGPFAKAGRLLMSASGKHLVFSTDIAKGLIYLDTKPIIKSEQLQNCVWSQDESRIALVATGTHGKAFVIVNGKRSREYEKIGHLAFSADKKYVMYVALLNGKLERVKQYY